MLASRTQYYSALERNEMLSYATTCVNHEDVMLSEVSQTQKDQGCMAPVTCGT